MFRFSKEQKVFSIGGIKVGGQPGEYPPLLIASMFHNKDKILVDRKGNFDRQKAKELIKKQEELSDFAEFLLERRRRKGSGPLRQDWAGTLKAYSKQFTALALQQKALDWRGD